MNERITQRQLANIKVRIAKYRCHLYFNHGCKEIYVLPSSLRFRPPLRSTKGYKLIVRTGFSFLKQRIDECNSSILRLRKSGSNHTADWDLAHANHGKTDQ